MVTNGEYGQMAACPPNIQNRNILEDTMFTKYDLGDLGRKYLSEELRNGNSYAQAIERVPLIGEGAVYTYLPVALGSAVNELDDGILKRYDDLGMSGADLHHQIESFRSTLFSRFLASRANGYIIFERIGKPQSPTVRQDGTPYFVFNSDVYLFLTASSVSSAAIEACLRRTRRYPLIIGLTSCQEPSLEISSGEAIDLRTLELYAERTEILLVGAYDDEGYIIWNRGSFDF